MKKREKRIEKTIILTIIISPVGIPAEYLGEKGEIYQPPNNTL
ncbi:hypothetical protein AYI68_g5611, partial [Smittium mucronatum]